MAKLTIDDVITKSSNIFKKDAFIVDNRYCLGGINSEHDNISEFMCVYNTDMMNVLKERFPDNKVVSILDLKKSKKEPDTYIKTNLPEEDVKEIVDRRDKLEKLVLSINEWKSFEFNECDLDTLFEKYHSLELFTDDEKCPSVTITKSLFPLIKTTDGSNIYYKVILPKDDDGLIQLVINYDTEWFQVYNLVQYIKMK